MRTPSLLGLSLTLPLACGLADPTETGSSTEELRPLTPFAMQFAGTYRAAAPRWGDVQALHWDRYGRYAADIEGRPPERGRVMAARGTVLPLTLELWSGRERWSATIRAYDRALDVEKNGRHVTLHADGIVGPDETLCDASGGAWTDDDPDPRTGLYCVCPPGDVYLPSDGGCVP